MLAGAVDDPGAGFPSGGVYPPAFPDPPGLDAKFPCPAADPLPPGCPWKGGVVAAELPWAPPPPPVELIGPKVEVPPGFDGVEEEGFKVPPAPTVIG